MLIEIEYLTLHDFGVFVSIRLPYYALVVATVFAFIGTEKTIEFFGEYLYHVVGLIFTIFTLLIYAITTTTTYQKRRMLYSKFKLLCFKEIQDKEALSNKTQISSKNCCKNN